MIKVKSEHSDSIATACVCVCMHASFKHARTGEDWEYTPYHIEMLLLKCLWLKHVATTLWSVARVETSWDSPLPRSKTISNTCLILFWSRHTVPDNTGCWAEWSREFRGDDCHGSSSPIFSPLFRTAMRSKDYGSPNARKRCYILGARKDICSADTQSIGELPFIAGGFALGRLERIGYM